MHTELRNGRAAKGSQKHLQDLVNDRSEQLNRMILSSSPSLAAFASDDPVWRSPLESESYREYQNSKFLEVVGLLGIQEALSDFWPSGGPVWDALATVQGRTGEHGVILLEAKSHILELDSGGCGACFKSLEKVQHTLDEVKQYLSAPGNANWTGRYYQYANRLAHLYFLNIKCGVPAWLVYLYFLGDTEQKGPDTKEEWKPALEAMRQELQLPERHSLKDWVVSVFAPIDQM